MKTMQFAAYEEKIKGLPSVSLRYIIKDATEALEAMPDSPNAGYYQDEILICSQELTRRMKKKCNREEAYHQTLNNIWNILRSAGYDSNDIVDDLRDLVADSYRPATDEDAGDDKDELVTKQDLVNAVAASLAIWWKERSSTDTDLLWEAYAALEYLYPDEADR